MDKMIQTPGRNPVASSALENFIPNESCPFSSSLSDFFTRKVRLSTNDILSHRYTDTLASCYEVKEPYVSTKDNGEQTIGSLLPEEDDLFSGMIDELGYTAHANRSNDEEDFDLFSSSGGMELDGHYSLPKDYPSEKYFNQGTLVVFNLDSSVSNDELHQTFGRFGEIKEIHGTPDKRYHRFIEYYDTQAAEAALHALNKTDINIDGRWIKFELRHPWSAKQCLMQQFSPDLLQDELIPCRIPSDESSVECIGTNGTHLHIVDSNGHPVDHHVFGSSGGGSFPLHGHCHVWSTSNSLQHHPPSPMVWPNTPLHFNGIHAHCTPKLPLLSRAPSHVLNTHQHHIGSAPAINPFQWDRQNAYKGGSPEAFGFHLDSFGSVGFSNSSLLNLSNCMDKSANSAQCSPLHNCNILPRRNAVTSAPTSFVTPNDRMRNLSHRRIEADSGHADKKKYELDIDRVLRREDNRTTLMIKNIPNKYTSKLLLAAIDEHHRGTYDFLYLPIDFKNNCNMGYAFINMIDSLQIIPFHKAFNGKKWEKFYSEKVASLAYARIQGKAALVAHFQNSSLMNEDKRCRPILFHNDGPNAGDQEPFPMGTSIRSRP